MCKRCKNKYDDFNHCDNCNKFFIDPEPSLWYIKDLKNNEELRVCNKCLNKIEKQNKELEQ